MASKAGGLFFFLNELDYTNKSLKDKPTCSGEGVLTSRSWIQVVQKGEAGKADSVGRHMKAIREGADKEGQL